MPAPTDQEELELTTSFIDEASRSLVKFKADLDELTTGTGKARLEAFRRSQEETGKTIKELTEATLHGDKGLFSYATRLGVAGAAVGGVGLAVHEGLEGLKAYSDAIVDLGNKAQAMGVPFPELKSLIEQFERMGVPAAAVEQSLAGVNEKLGAIGRLGSSERQAMIDHAGRFKVEMAALIDKLEHSDQQSDLVNIALEASQNVFDNRLKKHCVTVADATKSQNDFLKLLDINPLLAHHG